MRDETTAMSSSPVEPERPPVLLGREVAITGRLRSMDRSDAVRSILEAGGRYVDLPSRKTDLLVVGDDGPPLAKDGRLSRSLRRAEELRREGREIEIISETDLVARLRPPQDARDGGADAEASGDGAGDGQQQRFYTMAQLSRILGVPITTIRSWVRHELIRPVKTVKRLSYFDFGQVATARTLSQLMDSGVTPARLRKSLAALSRWIPDTAQALSQIEALEQGGPLVVRLDDGSLAEPSGQLRLDFGGSSGEPTTPPAPSRLTRHLFAPQGEAARSFADGVHAEEDGRPEEAIACYRLAIEQGGPRAEISFNLGNVHYAAGDKREAARAFLQATELEPDYLEAWNNLGNALSDLGQLEEAIACYRRALSLAPDYADAHYNLAETLAARGDFIQAFHHWLGYLTLDPDSPWAKIVRERLAQVRRRM